MDELERLENAIADHEKAARASRDGGANIDGSRQRGETAVQRAAELRDAFEAFKAANSNS